MNLIAGSQSQQLVEVKERGDGFGVVFISLGLSEQYFTAEESGSSEYDILAMRSLA